MIYLDLLFLSNFLLDWTILLFTAQITKEQINYFRIFLGTLVAVTSLVLFFVPMPLLFIIFRFIFSLLIVYVAYPYTTLKKYIINLLIFYALSYLVAGILVSFNLSSNFMHIDFFNPKIWALLTISFIFANVLTYILKVQLYQQQLYLPVQLEFAGKTYQLIGYYDTGNDAAGARDVPVVFVQAFRLGTIDESFLQEHGIEYEYITLQTLNQTSQTLAFKPTMFKVKEGRRYKTCEVLIAIIDSERSHGAYQVLLNRKIFE